jgi:hypothetical protein
VLGATTAVLWISPAILGPEIASYLAHQHAMEIRFHSSRPAWPFGISARRVELETHGWSLPLEDAQLRPSLEGLLGQATLWGGEVNLRLDWTGPAVLRAAGIALGEQARPADWTLDITGRLDGAARWTSKERSANVWITDGSVSVPSQVAVAVPFDLLVADAVEARATPGHWSIRAFQLSGQLMNLTASGTARAGGTVEARIRIVRMAEPLLQLLAARGLEIGPLPREFRLHGPLARPTLESLSE